jgi:hypothetical protein
MGSGGTVPPFLTSAVDGGERSASRPGRFTPRERIDYTLWIRGSVGPRAGVDAVVKRKILLLSGIIIIIELVKKFPLSQMKPVHPLTGDSHKVLFDIILPSTPQSTM